MTSERREAPSPDLAGGSENLATVSQRITHASPGPAVKPPDVPALPPELSPAGRTVAQALGASTAQDPQATGPYGFSIG
jgi:hypothetical protein